MLFSAPFPRDNTNKELLPMNSIEFPYMCNYTEFDERIDKCVPWHWHPSFEFNYVIEGEVIVRAAETAILLEQGDAVFINSGIIHEVCAKDRAEHARIYSHIFSPQFLSGMSGSIFEQKYISPVTSSRDLQFYIIRPNTHQKIRMIEKLLNTAELAKDEPFGYEFEIRAELCRLWCMLLKETEELRIHSAPKNTVDMDRIKIMMQYIYDHYMEKITLTDIALSANISSRECTRCFQRCIKTSPVSYLSEYRIRTAAEMLLTTDNSIISISENCGFSSASYFGKAFQEAMGCTPRDYRKVHAPGPHPGNL
ncbi:MAG: AraC family transcriptional regulator [Lachnospiraceae bacterium]|nr:AraC family transcriptional regulator [Lachnospiraceae bacterium]